MKKLLTANILLLTSFVYVIYRITENLLYIPKLSILAKNPVSLDWNSIDIDTGFGKDKFGESIHDSIYHIWMSPVYFAVIIAIILTFLAFKKKS